MRWNPLHQCLTMAVAGVLCIGGLPGRADADERVQPATLGLSGLIQEVLAQNPEIQAARQQVEAATQRVPQARSLDDPTLSVQLWNFPQTVNVTQTQNAIFGVSKTFPFPDKLALKGEVASRSADMTEQALRAKERDLIARKMRVVPDDMNGVRHGIGRVRIPAGNTEFSLRADDTGQARANESRSWNIARYR